MPRLLAFSGSSRSGSYNQRLAECAARAAIDAGAEVTLINLRDFPLPLFDEDVEAAGRPEMATHLKQLFLSHQGLLIASPEYNSSVSALLKNALDWVSRREAGEPRLAAFQGKTVGLLGASTGALGGLRGLVHLRAILGNVGCLVLPEQVTIPHADRAFSPSGELLDAAHQNAVNALSLRLVQVLQALPG